MWSVPGTLYIGLESQFMETLLFILGKTHEEFNPVLLCGHSWFNVDKQGGAGI